MKIKNVIICLILIIVIIIGSGVMINFYVKKSTNNQIIKAEDASEIKNVDCILVLGAAIWGEKPSPILEDRLLRGIDLYKQGVSTKILMSGDHGRKDYDEVNTMKEFAIRKGIPSEDIFMDHAGFSTYESIYRAKEIFGVKKMIIVTQEYHLYRALYIANKLGIESYGVNSDLRVYEGREYRELREIIARDKDFVKCIFKPKPTYLGEQIPVSGNGDVTNDKINKKNEDNTNDISDSNVEEYVDVEKNKAEELLKTMTLEEKVGQLFMARYPETGANSEIIQNNPGGYILFGKDFKDETKSSMLKKINKHQENSKIKMFMGVDEEGGTVARVSLYSNFRNERFKSPQDLYKEGGLNRIIMDTKEKDNLLKSIGININFAPVADISEDAGAFIYKRTLGKNAEETGKYIEKVVSTMNTDNMISVLKHFPGYGNNVDTHTGIAIDERKYKVFEDSEFIPFIDGIEADAPVILVNHNIVKCMDSKFPASLSSKVHEILRKKLNFDGIIITDDLAMDAVKKYAENGDAAVQAILAGNDMIISSDFVKQKKEILKAIEEGKIKENVINEAVLRILICKYKYKILV